MFRKLPDQVFVETVEFGRNLLDVTHDFIDRLALVVSPDDLRDDEDNPEEHLARPSFHLDAERLELCRVSHDTGQLLFDVPSNILLVSGLEDDLLAILRRNDGVVAARKADADSVRA